MRSHELTHTAPATPSQLRADDGVVAVEFALILPLLLMCLMAIIEFGQVFNNLNDANHIAGNGARFAAVDSKPAGWTGSLQDYMKSQGDTAKLRSTIGVCISFPGGASMSTIGSPVRVRVTSNYELIPLLGGVTIPLTATATMRIERSASVYSAGCS